MPEWLLKKDNYIPQRDNSDFINKSILSMLGALKKFRMRTGDKSNKLGVSAPFKVISTFVIIILLSLTRNFIVVLMINVYLLLIVSLLDVREIKYIIKVCIAAGAFTFIIMLPSMITGNTHNSIMITLKVLASITAVNITASTSNWNDITGTLKLFFIPDIFIFVLDVTIKYILILGEFSLNMVYALKIRSVGKNNNKNTSLSGIIGTMFIKSKEMAEEMQGAMECRGFTGEYRIYEKPKIKFGDYICAALNVIIILAYFNIDRL